MITLELDQNNNLRTGKVRFFWVYVVFALLSCVLIAGVFAISLPYFKAGLQHWNAYLNLDWAHQVELISVFINFILMGWFSFAALFLGGWLFRRSIRKMSGKKWSLASNNGKDRFFPPVMIFLKMSCLILMLVFVFVLLQYPLQFIY